MDPSTRPHVTVYVLFREICDQNGTFETVGVYSTQAAAEQAGESIRTRRTWVKAMWLDGAPAP